MLNITYRTIIEPDEKGFHGYVPALRGCHTWGKTIQDTQKHLHEAIGLYLESLEAHGEPIPDDRRAFHKKCNAGAYRIFRSEQIFDQGESRR